MLTRSFEFCAFVRKTYNNVAIEPAQSATIARGTADVQ
jgi:hypothetical protein